MKRTIVLLLALALMLTVLPLGVFAAEADPYFEGLGTAESPYLIQTPEDLATLVYLTTNYDNGYFNTTEGYPIPGTDKVWPADGAFGKAGYYSGRYNNVSSIRYYKMTDDLDMTGYDFNRGGICAGSSLEFRGSFDGDGHVIRNWKSSSSAGGEGNGIFSAVALGNVPGQGVRNVGVENATVTSDKFVSGVLIGFLRPLANADNTAVENCYVKNSSSQIKSRDTAPANGGIVGCLNFTAGSASTAVIRNCYAEGIRLLNDQGVEDGQPDYGGIVGRIWHNWIKDNKAHVSNCYSVGSETRAYLPPIGPGAVPGNSTHGTFSFADCYSLSANGTDWSKWESGTSSLAPVATVTDLSALTVAELGADFMNDVLGLNGGLPVLTWEYTYITNTIAACENGSLDVTEESGKVKKDGNTVYIKTGADLTVTANPSAGYSLSSVKYGGEDKTADFGVSGSAKFAFANLTDNGTWSAEFKKSPTTPSITADKTATIATYGDDNAPAAVVYAKFSGVNPSEYGMVITRTSDGKYLTLEAADNKDGAFAIKVYGVGVNEGSFTMKPYYKDSENTEYGNETEAFSLSK